MIHAKMIEARTEAKWSQEEAANAMSCNRTAYSKWESRSRPIPDKTLARFLKLAAEAKNLIGYDSIQSKDEDDNEVKPVHHSNHLRYTPLWIGKLFDPATHPNHIYNTCRTILGFPDCCEFAADTSPEGQDIAENQEENNEALKAELMRLEGAEYELWAKVRKLARKDATGYRQELVWELQWDLKEKGVPSPEMAAVRAELKELMIRKTNDRKELALGEDLV